MINIQVYPKKSEYEKRCDRDFERWLSLLPSLPPHKEATIECEICHKVKPCKFVDLHYGERPEERKWYCEPCYMKECDKLEKEDERIKTQYVR